MKRQNAPGKTGTAPIQRSGHPPGFDLLYAYEMANHAMLSYDREEHARGASSRGLGFNWIENGPAQCSILPSRDLILVVFPGSADAGDWLDDAASTCRTRWSGDLPGKVGRGFLRQAESLWPVVNRTVRLSAGYNTSAKVILVGHSLGAAIATIMRVFLERRSGILTECLYSYGSPRVGDAEFSDWYRRAMTGHHWSIRNTAEGRADLVTRIPKRSWGFRHVGVPVLLTGGGLSFSVDRWHAIRQGDPVGSFRCAKIIRQAMRDIRTHSMGETVSALERLNRQENG